MNKSEYRLGLYEKAMPDFDSWEQKLELTRSSGFDWMEISIDESDKKLLRLNYSPTQRGEIREAIVSSGVPIHTMCLSGHRKYPLGSRSPDVRKQGMEILERALELSAEIGVRIIQLAGYDVYYEPSGEDTRAYFMENLIKGTERAAQYGVTMGFETMETPFMDTTTKGMECVKQVNSPYLGMYPDIGNLKNAAVLYGKDVVEDLTSGRGHIFAAHLKETAPGVYRDMKFGTTGHTEYTRCIHELWGQGVRMYTGEFWYHGEEDYVQTLQNASIFLRTKISAASSF